MEKLNINLEKIILILISITFFIGIWHALPMLKVVGDEMYFVGGVLRAMENHTILPAPGDVPYGTLTYFLNYILVGIFLAVLLPFFKIDLQALKFFLVEKPEIIYIIPRLLSAMLAVLFLYLIYKILKQEFEDKKIRFFLIILVFTNMLTTLVLHTGKMWVLSTLLVLASFYFLYKSLYFKQRSEDKKIPKNIFFSILFSFLAVANMPFFAYALINIPLILLFFWRRKELRLKIVKYIIIGAVVFLIILLANLSGIKELVYNTFTYYNPILDTQAVSSNLSIPASLALNFVKILAFFPLLVLALLLVLKNKIKNKYLFIISMAYFLAYYLSVSIGATWTVSLYSYTRYSFPLGFFLILIIASFNVQFKKIFYVLGFVSIIYFIPTIYFLSVPTTLNQARNWILDNINYDNIVIDSRVRSLELPKNKKSYEAVKEEYCSSKCKNIIKNNLNNNFKPLLIDKYTRNDFAPEDGDKKYLVTGEILKDQIPVVSFTNKVGIGYDVDGRMANYFDLYFFTIKNFGSDIFIYTQD
ncbi:MAG: hypothetical protein ABIJ91_01055 [Candidatus Kuenenbacteria bacterium]